MIRGTTEKCASPKDASKQVVNIPNPGYNIEALKAEALRQAEIVQKSVDRYLIDNNIKTKRKGASSLDVRAAKLRELGRMISGY